MFTSTLLLFLLINILKRKIVKTLTSHFHLDFNEYFEQNYKRETNINVGNFDFVRKMLYKTSKR